MKTIDMLGKPCPMPVVEAKKALMEETDGVVVLVDNIVAVQNLQKMAEGKGYGFSRAQEEDGVYSVSIQIGGVPAGERDAAPQMEKNDARGATVLITSDQIGHGSEELGKILIKGFLFSLTELSAPPEAVIFLNSGAYLTAGGANVVEDLKKLEAGGTAIRTCGTCLNYYGLTEKLAVGKITDMMGIVNILAEAEKLITI